MGDTKMKHQTFLRRLSLGLSLAGVAIAIACGSDGDDTPAAASSSAGAPSTGGGSLQPSPAGGGQGPIGTSEGNPGTIALDPNRDPSAPINLLASGAVECGPGDSYCVAPNLTCCAGPMNAFSCAADAAQCPDGTTSSTACSSAASCAAGQVCCRTGGGGGPGGNAPTTTCEASCGDGTQQVCLDDGECGADNVCTNGTCAPAPCTATSCGAGELCCRGQGGGGQGAAPACVAAAADGLCPDNRRQVCTDDAQCPAGNTCAPLFGGGGGGGGGGMGGALVCTPPACTPDSCEAGQVCCVGGGIGTPTCSAASDTGACPGNSRLVCTTDAECAPSPGTECLPNPFGGGAQLSCRVPPPVAADAGVDAG
ncbi:MAG TPA: hypothetical protein VMG12_44475 [Polyangiaceae bacterium]|nr:hypothetical protein [Polyangiaceae bacterium]